MKSFMISKMAVIVVMVIAITVIILDLARLSN